jgi:hypothetical protein
MRFMPLIYRQIALLTIVSACFIEGKKFLLVGRVKDYVELIYVSLKKDKQQKQHTACVNIKVNVQVQLLGKQLTI